jgi:ABC-type lipopolysaccharide export system ATPase subunit
MWKKRAAVNEPWKCPGTMSSRTKKAEGAAEKPRHRSFGRRAADAGNSARAHPQSKVTLLDEPFGGLAPVIVRDLVKACRDLVDAGQTIILVEQNLSAALTLAHRAYIINNGHIAHEGPTSEITARPKVLERYLGV